LWFLAKIAMPVYTLANLLYGVALVKSHVGKISLGIVVVLAMLFSACLVSPGVKGNKPPVISSIEAEYINVYPRANSEIRCVASDPEGDEMQFKWSSDGGKLTGDGSIAIWEAPIDYGDYHITVIAKDGNGSSAEATLAISVIPRPHCCGR
jgi:hypothetical protein